MSIDGIFGSSKLLSDMLKCKKLTGDDKELLRKFYLRAAFRLDQVCASEPHRNALMATIRSPQDEDFKFSTKSEDGISTLQSLFQDVLDDLRVLKKSLKKGEDAVINALYICILAMLTDKLVAEDFKYPTRDAFMQVYGEKFAAESDLEKYLLWQTANWMCILFKIVKANANLGLAMAVIPKLLEGWNKKYITGGGMKGATDNRVHVFRVEGNVRKVPRVKTKAAKSEHEGSSSDENGRT
eukprot:gene23571-30563_t